MGSTRAAEKCLCHVPITHEAATYLPTGYQAVVEGTGFSGCEFHLHTVISRQ